MTQSRTMSLAESVTNVLAGFVIALLVQILLFRALGIVATPAENILITLIFTIVSLIRSYCVRRLFNSLPARSTSQGISP